ncbi:MAG: glycosyltransferase family 2 protein [Endomicrobiia bacterium]|nr:glycosyltransferase family 2 protein [Endomicrobiia bacterium]
MSVPQVLIVIVNYNNPGDTLECLESVFGGSYKDFTVAVVDNASSDGSADIIERWAREKHIGFISLNEPGGSDNTLNIPTDNVRLRLLRNRENKGFAGGNNSGINIALASERYKYVWLLNNDTVAGKDALLHLVGMAEKDPRAGVVGSKWLYYDRPETVQLAGGGRFIPWLGVIKQIGRGESAESGLSDGVKPDYIGGASMLVRTDVIRKIGAMNEYYFLYWEDTEWSERIRRNGWKLAYEPRSMIRHKGSATTGAASSATDYYYTRNSVLFIYKYYKIFLLPSLIVNVLGRSLVRLSRGRFDRIKIIFSGARDGLKHCFVKTKC